MGEREWNFKYAGISVFVGVVLGLLTMLIASSLGDLSQKLDAIAGLLTGLSGLIVTMQILQNRELSNVEQLARDAIRVGTRASSIGSTNSALMRKIQRVQNLPPIVAETALRALQEAIQGIDVEQDNLSTHIKDRRLALHCYEYFWKKMVALQEQTKKPMIARLTHSSDVDLFYDEYARSLKGLHLAFVTRGTIFRILVDREPVDLDRTQRYLTAIEDMSGIQCAYINISDRPYLMGDHEAFEFCLIEGRIKYASEWKLRNLKDVDGHVVTTDMIRYNHHLSSWNMLVALIRTDDYNPTKFSTEHREQLISLQQCFLSKHDLIAP